MGEAAQLAEETGETRDYTLAFGPLNVHLHEIAAAGDQNNYDEALAVASDIRLPDDYPPTRAAHFWIDKARAETWTARNDEALTSLNAARAASPQLTRYHHSVHETVATLLRARQRASSELRDYALWCLRLTVSSTSVKPCGVDTWSTPQGFPVDTMSHKEDPGDRVNGPGAWPT